MEQWRDSDCDAVARCVHDPDGPVLPLGRLIRGSCFQSSRIQEGLISGEDSSRTSETTDTVSRLERVPV